MKQPTSFRLSNKAKNSLKILAKRFNISQTEVLERIICEFLPSTKEEKLEQKVQHGIAFNNFVDSIHPRINTHDDIASAWKQGFNVGWEQFQTRKSSSLFKLKKSIN